MQILIDIPEDIYKSKDDEDYIRMCASNICEAFENGTPIPDNATNGDAVKTLFSDTLDNFCERTTWKWNSWWNAPYQKGGKG